MSTAVFAPFEPPALSDIAADDNRRSQQWLSRLALREVGQRVIEAGCGVGSWTRLLLKNREQVVSLDREASTVAGLLSRFHNYRNLDAMTMELSAPRFRDLARYQPDSVLCVDALAKEVDDQRALFNFTTVLPKGGRVVLMLPACPALYGCLDAALGHRRRYSKDSLRELSESVGLKVRKMRYVNIAGYFGWWLDTRVLETVEMAAPSALRERIVPYLERVEQLIAPPFGQSLFAVLELPR